MSGSRTGRPKASRFKREPWARSFRALMNAGVLICFMPRCNNKAERFGHIKSEGSGGNSTMNNIACVCEECDIFMETYDWTDKVVSIRDVLEDRRNNGTEYSY